MKLDYTYNSERVFPHWVEQLQTVMNGGRLGIDEQMNINEWCSEQFGELGTLWGFYYELPPPGSLFTAKFLYSWRFKNEDDAMFFKLTWG